MLACLFMRLWLSDAHVMCKCMCVHVSVVGSHVYMLVWILRGARLSRCLRALAGFDKSSLVRLCKANHQCMCMQSKRAALHIHTGTRICTKYRSITNAGRCSCDHFAFSQNPKTPDAHKILLAETLNPNH